MTANETKPPEGAGKVGRPPDRRICERRVCENNTDFARRREDRRRSEDDYADAWREYANELERRAKALADAGHKLRHIWADDNAASAMQWDEDEKALRELLEGE